MRTAALGLDRALRARDLMQYHVVTIPPEATIRELVQILTEESISGAPVLDGNGRILGVVSATDVMRLAAREAEIPAGQLSWEPMLHPDEEDEDSGAGYFLPPPEPVRFTAPVLDETAEAAFDRLHVRDIMTPVAFAVKPDAQLAEVVRLLVRGRIHRVLVVEHGMLLGIVTSFDILRRLLDTE